MFELCWPSQMLKVLSVLHVKTTTTFLKKDIYRYVWRWWIGVWNLNLLLIVQCLFCRKKWLRVNCLSFTDSYSLSMSRTVCYHGDEVTLLNKPRRSQLVINQICWPSSYLMILKLWPHLFVSTSVCSFLFSCLSKNGWLKFSELV